MKRIVKIILSLSLVLSLFASTTAFAEDNTISDANEFTSIVNDQYGVNAEIKESVPENVVPKEFDTWEEALAWIGQVEAEIDANNSKVNALMSTSSSFTNILNDGFEFTGDVGSVKYSSMPTNASGTLQKSNTYSVPGTSAQTVKATYYFEYSKLAVTSSSASASISGVGISTYSTTYSQLQKVGSSPIYNYYHVLKGNVGYFISVAGQVIGFSDVLELDYCIYNYSVTTTIAND